MNRKEELQGHGYFRKKKWAKGLASGIALGVAVITFGGATGVSAAEGIESNTSSGIASTLNGESAQSKEPDQAETTPEGIESNTIDITSTSNGKSDQSKELGQDEKTPVGMGSNTSLGIASTSNGEEDLVEKAEQAYAELNKAITAAGKLVTPAELEGLEAKLTEAQKEKQAAQAAVTALPDTVKTQKDGFQGRLDKLVDPALPTVNDADSNGIADDVDTQVKNASEQSKELGKAEKNQKEVKTILIRGALDLLT